ncbi:MAG: hypothetical protein FWD31_15095 [Planctomycetaceae bacterium]|nr:hypothetical protein [Planctomycetaceae bacterium]
MIDINQWDLWNQPDEGDPLVWIRKHRDELAEKYPTIDELMAYYRSIPSAEELITRNESKIADKSE